MITRRTAVAAGMLPFVLPHLGSAAVEARTEMGEKVIINIKTWMDGHKPPDRVLTSML